MKKIIILAAVVIGVVSLAPAQGAKKMPMTTTHHTMAAHHVTVHHHKPVHHMAKHKAKHHMTKHMMKHMPMHKKTIMKAKPAATRVGKPKSH